MRYLVALSLCMLLASPQAYACRDPKSGTSLFFWTIPSPQPDADLIARVTLSEVTEHMGWGMAMATIIEVLMAADTRIHQGDKIAVKYRATSCGPDQMDGDSGTIIAKIGTDMKGHLFLYPYMHDHRGQIDPPPTGDLAH